jgi:hypothetical protein
MQRYEKIAIILAVGILFSWLGALVHRASGAIAAGQRAAATAPVLPILTIDPAKAASHVLPVGTDITDADGTRWHVIGLLTMTKVGTTPPPPPPPPPAGKAVLTGIVQEPTDTPVTEGVAGNSYRVVGTGLPIGGAAGVGFCA